MNCGKCHGWKELEYHPMNYKTRQCSNGTKCPKGKICPYYHTPSEKRKLSEKVKSGYFTYYPRNRRIGEQTETIEDFKNMIIQKESNHKVLALGDNPVPNSDALSESSDGSVAEDEDIRNEEIESMVKKLIDE